MIMECSRTGCQIILCERYSRVWGLICNECFDELVATRSTDIAAFMRSEKPYPDGPNEEVYEQIFPIV
jgi:hypothetical protein